MTAREPVSVRPTARRAGAAVFLLQLASGTMLLEALVVLEGGGAAGILTVAAVISGAAFLVSIAAFLAWLSRSVENAAALGDPPPPHTPRGAILWWFVPLANVFIPYRVVADLAWRAGVERRLVWAWWALWLVPVVAGGVMGGLAAVSPISLSTRVTVAVAGSVARAVSGFLLAVVVSRIENATGAARLASGARPWAPDAEAEGHPVIAPVLDAEFCPECDRVRLTAGRHCAGCGFDYAAT